jgi:hypothetical protein
MSDLSHSVTWYLYQWERGRQSVTWGNHRVHIFTRDETGSVYLPTQLEHTLQLYWWWYMYGKCNERGWACTLHPQQPGLILPSWLNIRQNAVTTLFTLWRKALGRRAPHPPPPTHPLPPGPGPPNTLSHVVVTGLPDGCGHGRITQNQHSCIHVYKYMLGVCKTQDVIFY